MLPTARFYRFLATRVARQRASQAAMEALDNDSLSQVTGQAGISLRLDLRAGAARVAWVDDGGSLSLRNLVIDNGCVKASDCPDGRGGSIPLGAAQLGLSLPIFGVEQPTLALDVTTGSGGGQQLAISLPDLATINDQLIATACRRSASACGWPATCTSATTRSAASNCATSPTCAARSRLGSLRWRRRRRVQESCRSETSFRAGGNQPVSSQSQLAGRTECSVPGGHEHTRLPPVGWMSTCRCGGCRHWRAAMLRATRHR